VTEQEVLQVAADCWERSATFFLFREPQGPITLWVQEQSSLIKFGDLPRDSTHDLVRIAPFLGASWALRKDLCFQEGDSLTHQSLSVLPFSGKTATEQPQLGQTGYCKLVENAIAEMQVTALKKVALSRVLTVDTRARTAVDLFQHGCTRLPEAFCYLLHAPETGTWLGAAPEQLLAVQDDRITIDSIAATRKREDVPDQIEDWNEKEQQEQAIVTQRIIHVLEDTGFSDMSVSPLTVRHAGPVSHLHTQISAALDQSKLNALISTLHPTPAVGGEPKELAHQFIAEHEVHDRQLYTGYLGPWRPSGNSALYVNIRCMQLFPSKAQLYLGCGITAKSDPLAEWEETRNKARTWMDILAH